MQRSVRVPRFGSHVVASALAIALCGLTLFATRAIGHPGDEPGAAGAKPAESREPFPAKETLRYRVLVWKGFEGLGAEIGTGELKLERTKLGERTVYQLDAEGKGGAFGYDLHTIIHSTLGRDGLAPIGYELDQRGNEIRRYRMVFDGGHVIYRKWKHCKVGIGCPENDHFVTVTKRRFFIGPKYTETIHCEEEEEECASESHFYWQDRNDRECAPGTYDMLSAVYVARTLGLAPGGPSRTVTAADRHDTWDVKVTPAAALETVELPSGKREALLLTLEPEPTKGSTGVREEFRGLFGMHGALKIWVDPDTCVPVKILGVIPFGVNINCQIELTGEERTEDDGSKTGDF